MAFLTFVTRCCQRPIQLQKNIESVQSQSSNDWEQLFLVDEKNHRDIPWANQQLDRYKEYISGKWVFILDDDCKLIDNQFVEGVARAIATSSGVGLVMVRTQRPQWEPTILPPDDKWGGMNAYKLRGDIGNHINCLAYVVKRDLWCRTIKEFCGHSGARTFFQAVLMENPIIAWVDQVMSTTQQLGRGKHFEDCQSGWFEEIVDRYSLGKIAQGVWKGRKV